MACTLLATLLGPAPIAQAAEPSPPIIDLCAQFNLDPCPVGADALQMVDPLRRYLPNGCYNDFASIPPTIISRYDKDLQAYINILYAGVAVQVFCPTPANLTAFAESIPAASTSTGSVIQERNTCNVATYCEASAVWATNKILPVPACSYTSAWGMAGVLTGGYWPSWTTFGYDCS